MKSLSTLAVGVAALVIGVAAGIVAGFALSDPLAVLIGIGAGVAGGFIALRFTRSGRAQPQQAAPAAPAEPDVRGMMQRLVELDIRARTLGFPAAPLTRVESAVDLLRELVPEVNDNYPSNAVTWEVNRACTDYLPHIAGRYAGLTGAQRAAHEAEANESLDALIGALERAREAVRAQKADEMSVAAKFMGARFGEATR